MPHFLLTNDDGIDAPGLAALEKAVASLPDARLTIVAPATEQSQCGHRVTTATALRVDTRSESRFAVHGTPADCVRVALFALGLRPDVVLSGINQGGNLGQDIVISGTVAAAREATYHGISAFSLSHYIKRGLPIDWNRDAQWIAEVLDHEMKQTLPRGHFININLPHLPTDHGPICPTVIDCAPAVSPIPVAFQSTDGNDYQYTGSYADRPRDPNSDVAICFGGQISRSLLAL